MINRFELHNQHVDGLAKDLYDLSTCSHILDVMGLDNQTKFQAFELLHKKDKEMRKAFVCWQPEFRQFWSKNMLGSE